MNTLHRICLAALALSAAVAVTGLGTEPTQSDIEYAHVGERRLVLDFYQPSKPSAGNLPLVVWIHGGAWRSGSKSSVPVTHWLQHGFAIASVDYRLSPEARFPAQIHDIKAAIRFLRANAKRFGVAPDEFVIAGASAGGHLAALVGVSHGNAMLEGELGEHGGTSSAVQAIVSFYGAANLQTILSQSTEHGLGVRVPALQLLLGGQPTDVPKLAKLASPVALVDAHDPPLWLIHGDADPQMPFAQSEELRASYQAMSLPVHLEVVARGQHGGPEFYTDTRLSRLASQLKSMLADARRREAHLPPTIPE